MTIPRRKKPGPKRKPTLRSKDIGGAKQLLGGSQRLRPLAAHHPVDGPQADQVYFLGWAEADEVEAHLAKLDAAEH